NRSARVHSWGLNYGLCTAHASIGWRRRDRREARARAPEPSSARRRARGVTSASSGGGTRPTVPAERPPPAARSQSPSGPRGRRHRGSALRRALAPARVELVEEVPAPLGLVGLADGPSDTGQARQAAEEPAVRLVAGTHVAR